MSQAASDQHFLNPQSSVGVFTLPCGYIDGEGKLHREVHLRELTGVEEEILSGRGEGEAKLSKTISNCITDIGGQKGSVQMVREMTVIDRIFLVVALRRVSLGDKYTMRVTCPVCDSEDTYSIDLGDDLEVKPMEDPMEREFFDTLPSGRTVKWHVMTGADEGWLAKATKKMKDQGRITLSLLARVDQLDGTQVRHDADDRKGLIQSVSALAKLSLRDRNYLRRLFLTRGGDIDTDLEFTCTNETCGHEFEGEMEVTTQDFFFPSEM